MEDRLYLRAVKELAWNEKANQSSPETVVFIAV